MGVRPVFPFSDLNEDPAQALLTMVRAYMVSQITGAVARLGVADQLAAGPLGVEELGDRLGIKPYNLYRLLRAAATAGLIEESPPRTFALNSISQLLRSESMDRMRSIAAAFTGPAHWLPWSRLDEAVRSGRMQTPATLEAGFFDYYRHHPDEGRFFAGMMSERTRMQTAEIMRAYDFSRFTRVVDIGGSHGDLLAAVLQAAPEAGGVLFDLPEVIEGARSNLEALGLADRCEMVAGNFFETVPVGGDAYLLKWILHDWADNKRV